MLPQIAIEAFLTQERNDHRWLKDLSAVDIDAALKSIKPVPPVDPRMRLHQRVGILLGVAYPQFCFFYDMGTGKTALTLHLLQYWWQLGLIRRALILVTSDKAFPTWEAQIAEWKIDIPVLTLSDGSSEQKRRALEQFERGLILLTYPGLVYLATRLSKNKKGGNARKVDPNLVDKLSFQLDALILDESTRVATYGSLTTQVCIRLRRNVHICYALAGRPFGRDPMMLWSQFRIVDGGQTLGETMGLFRAAYYTEADNPWTKNPYAKDYTFRKKLLPRLMQQVQHRSLAYSADECIDLPKMVQVVEEVALPQEASVYYRRVVDQIIAARGNLKEMENAFIRMRQLSSGFLGLRDKADDTRVEVAFKDSPKLELLLDLVQSLPEETKAVVFYQFTYSGKMIMSRLKEIGREGIWLWSGTKNYRQALDSFQRSKSCTVAVINNQVGAYSLDGLQNVANYMFFYESPVSPIDREQAERRLLRDGQKCRVFVYDLMVKGTLDKRIREFHSEGDEILAALRANPKRILQG